jgi:phage/plasmid-associated DNA primase
MMEALGAYAKQAAPDLLLVKRSSHPTQLADLFGTRFVVSVDTDKGRRLVEGLVKRLPGRDPIRLAGCNLT